MSARSPVSVVIPNYSGLALLQKHLPSVTAVLNSTDELIIVDDASTDTSVEWLSQWLPTQTSGWKYQIITNPTNLRYARSVNAGVAAAKHPLVFLLNNDVSIEANTIEALVRRFETAQQSGTVFAIGCLEYEGADTSAQKAGKNTLDFSRGRFEHARASEFSSGPTAWASGGSALFNRSLWMELGGYDERFAPAYWEDVDLSARARKRGWQVLFESSAVVYHQHESTNASVFDSTELIRTSWEHGGLFTRKHANIVQWLMYFFWWPVRELQLMRMTRKIRSFTLFLAILVLAVLMRLWQFPSIPSGLAWDEAAIGYNGYAVATVHRDEWLTFMPISFRSFGDYKAPLAIYISGVVTSLTGLTVWGVRLPFVLAGCAAVAVWYGILKSIWGGQHTYLALVGALFLAISPWHIHFSRAAFESGYALFLTLCMVWGLLEASATPCLNPKRQYWWYALASSAAAASLYVYHSSKLVTPLLWVVVWLYGARRKQLGSFIVSSTLVVVMSLPLLYDAFFGEGLTRASTLFLAHSATPTAHLMQFGRHLATHLSPAFLVGGLTDSLRHGTGVWGVLLPVPFVLVVVGAIRWILARDRLSWLAVSWVGIGLLPAVLGETVPHANRALLAVPGFILLSLQGLAYVRASLVASVHRQLAFSLLAMLYIFSALQFTAHYFTVFGPASTDAYKDGYVQVFDAVYQAVRDSYTSTPINTIVFSNEYGQAYIYALFTAQTNPIEYQGGALARYRFVEQAGSEHLGAPNTLIVASQNTDLKSEDATKTIYGADGQARFFLYSPEYVATHSR